MKWQKGVTLTELLIALVLGILLLGGVLGVFLSNQTTSRTTEDLSNLQDRIRLAFQVMSYDLRSAGFLGCNNSERVISVVQVAGALPVWLNWQGGLVGTAADAANNESMRIMYAAGQSASINTHVPPRMNLNQDTNLSVGDLGVICDDTLTSIFQVSAVGNNWAEHAAAGLNCSADLGFANPFICATARPRVYPADAMLMRFETVRWFVAASEVDNTLNSLFREIVVNGAVVQEEVLFGVERLSFAYQMRNAAFGPVPFSAALDMTQVTGVNVTILLDAAAYSNITMADDTRTIEFFTTVRNR
ncbi:PilW family protein [Alishewanella sp. HL-SH06]|uniref:PilW family protein n=1 Tax=Alishewanella sp. HL-SH06 TaxID=3461144 RepID=UPI004040F2B0